MRLLFACCLALAAPGYGAQAQAPDTTTLYKHHLGLTASPVLDGFFKNNRSLPVGLLYKRQVKANQAWRLGAVASYRYTKRYKPYPLTNRDFSESSLSAEAYTGYEFQKSLTRRWVAYAGLGVGVGYDQYLFREYSERGEVVNGAFTVFSVNERTVLRTYSGFVRPLVGVRCHLHSFLYLSVEAALPIQYAHYQMRSGTITAFRDTGELLGTGEGRSNEHRINLGLRPVSQISVHYLFGRLQ